MYDRKSLFGFLAAALAFGVSLAVACGPDFPWQLLDDRAGTLTATPVNSFAFEARLLVPPPTDRLQAVETREIEEARAAAESIGLTRDQADAVRLMRAAKDGTEALAHGETLPQGVRLYTAAAVDFHRGDFAGAQAGFEAVVGLDVDAARLRMVWAAYMLGRVYAEEEDDARAARAYALTRQLARDGAPDPLALAVASYGQEALLSLVRVRTAIDEGRRDFGADLSRAVLLYAEQAARGSRIGLDSLRIVAAEMLADDDQLRVALRERLVRRLIVIHALARAGDIVEQVDPDAWIDPDTQKDALGALDRIIRIIGQEQIDVSEDADRLAAAAYRIGRYDAAERLAAQASGPLAAWVKAKLALQKGDVTAAAAFHADAIGLDPFATLDAVNRDHLRGEAGLLALTRGDHRAALDSMYAAGGRFWGDVVHVAERVLTVDELKAFVDARVPAPAAKPVDRAGYWPAVNPPAQLRDLLARRLVRAGRYVEAAPYFADPATRETLATYAQALRDAETARDAIGRARAFYAAALLARGQGMELMGTEAAPDFFAYEGNFEIGLAQSKLEGEFIGDDERRRFDASALKPGLRWHYRYLAVDLISRAADLVPPRSQAFAALLCTGAGWMMRTPGTEVQVAALYARYVQQGPYVRWAAHFGNDCPDPDFDKAAEMARTQWQRDLRRFLSSHRWPIGIGLVLVIGGLLAWSILRARRAAA